MKRRWFRTIPALLCAVLLCSAWAKPVKAENAAGNYVIACVGDSITEGIGSSNSTYHSYPAQLQNLLGSRYEVINCGAGGTTLLKDNNAPCYRRQSRFSESRKCNPDIVIIMLGTNDSKPAHWAYKDNYVEQLVDLITVYQNLSSQPTVYVATSATVTKSLDGITDAIVTNEVVPLQKQAAKQAGCEVIDINAATKGHEDWYSDGVHLNDDGYAGLAEVFADFLSPRYDPSIVEAVIKRLEALPASPGAEYADEVDSIRYAFDHFSERQAKLVTEEQQKKLAAAEQSVRQKATTTLPPPTTTAVSPLPTTTTTIAGTGKTSGSGSSQPQDTTQTTLASASSSVEPITTSPPTGPSNTEPENTGPASSSHWWLFWCILLVIILAAGAVGIVLLKKRKGSFS